MKGHIVLNQMGVHRPLCGLMNIDLWKNNCQANNIQRTLVGCLKLVKNAHQAD
jgi:hypothetical protein